MLHYVKASSFIESFPDKEKQDVLRQGTSGSRIVPVVDKLFDYVTKTKDGIFLLSGGRGGAKSHATATKLIRECREAKYFKCYFGRNKMTAVRGTNHAELIKVIKEQRLEKEFFFSERPNGTRDIVDIASGNKFIAFGLDSPESLKGISDPTHIWIDEFDQVPEKSFSELLPTLRHSKEGSKMFIVTFNRYDVMFDHWIIRIFYPELYKGEKIVDTSGDIINLDVSKQYHIEDIFVNYSDNPFLPENYKSILYLSANGDPKIFAGYADGAWGASRLGSFWYNGFSESVHVSDEFDRDESLADHISIDWNAVPYMSMTCWQIKVSEEFVDLICYDEFAYESPLNSTEAIVKGFIAKHKTNSSSTVYYYGDAMGNRRIEGMGSTTRFDDVRKYMHKFIGSNSDRSIKYNPANIKRRDLMNRIFREMQKYGGKKVRIFIHSRCNKLIHDYQSVQDGVNGKVVTKGKWKGQNGVELNGHLSDTADYLFAYIFKDIL